MNREITKQQWKSSYSTLQGSIYLIKSHNFVVEIFHILAKFFLLFEVTEKARLVSHYDLHSYFMCWDLGHNVLNSVFSFGPKRFPFSIIWMCNIHFKETRPTHSFRESDISFQINLPGISVSVQGNTRLRFLMAKDCRNQCERFLSHSTSGPSASPVGF